MENTDTLTEQTTAVEPQKFLAEVQNHEMLSRFCGGVGFSHQDLPWINKLSLKQILFSHN